MRRAARKQYAAVLSSPVGLLGISIDNERLYAIDYLKHAQTSSSRRGLTAECARQLRAYFAEPGFAFDLPLLLNGTEHQQRVWHALQGINAGTTLGYGELANRLGSGARAVGNACRSNPIPIVIPCHRVVAANGPGGYSGTVKGVNLDRKLWLLQHESVRSARK